MRRIVSPALSGSILALGWALGPATAESPANGNRAIAVEEVRNDRPAFSVRVDVDHPNRTYQGGDEMFVKVVSGKKGYLYLIYESADKKLTCLFPNRIQKDNRIPARTEVVIPARDAKFRLRVGPPYGKELLKAIVTLWPVDVQQFGVKSLTQADATPLDSAGVKAVYVELERRPAAEWAEHQVRVTTVACRAGLKHRKPRRVILIIGISRFKDPRIRRLAVGDKDARRMADVMKKYGQMDEVMLLVNKDATLENIRKAICQTLAKKTLPGDDVLIYFSDHGGRCADDDNEERDGLDEYLVPYNGRLNDLTTIRQTMLLDDAFGRWLQCLDGRRVALILDTCCSGGQSKYEKGLGSGDPKPGTVFDFLDGELARTKDVGQAESAMLYSAKPDQIAFERRELDLSVMTHFLVGLLEEATGPITLTQAFDYVKVQVPRYVEQQLHGSSQTPGLINNLSTELYLRPAATETSETAR